MLVPTTVTDALVVMGFFFFGIAFLTLGMMAIGKGKADGAGTVFTLVGIINSILGFIIIIANLTSPVFISIGLLVLIFAFTWLAAGIINIRNYDLTPLGNANILSGLMMIPFAVFYISLGRGGQLSTIGWIWLTVNVLSWAVIFWSITLVTYGKMKLRTAGYIAIIQAFYTLWIPAALLLTGVFSLMPQ